MAETLSSFEITEKGKEEENLTMKAIKLKLPATPSTVKSTLKRCLFLFLNPSKSCLITCCSNRIREYDSRRILWKFAGR